MSRLFVTAGTHAPPLLATTSWAPTALACVLALTLIAVLLISVRRARGTTLVAPGLWSIAAVSAVALAELMVTARGAQDATWAAALRYAAAMTTFCPSMALLGAKRPQDHGWQWVVVTLLATLWLPVVQWYLLHGAGPLVLFAAWHLFVVALLVVGLLNYLPTRMAAAQLLVTLGQLALLADVTFGQTMVGERRLAPWAAATAMACFLMAAGTAYCLAHRKAVLGYDRLWLDFRDRFGAFWAVRVMQRVNETADLESWNVRLEWSGLQRVDAGETGSEPLESPLPDAAMERTFRTLLRRFVSAEWIDTRLAP